MISGKQVVPMPRLAGIACAVLALVACRATPEDIVAEHRPVVEKVFGQIKALDAGVRNVPPAIEDRIDVGSASVRLEGPESNALYVRAEHMLAPEKADLSLTHVTSSYKTQQCAKALLDASHELVAGLRATLPACGRAEYLFVQRTTLDEKAQLLDAHTFQPGRYEGEVLLFRLADGALLGGFRVSGKSSDSVMTAGEGSGAWSNPIGDINRDLAQSVDKDINSKLSPYAPGVVP